MEEQAIREQEKRLEHKIKRGSEIHKDVILSKTEEMRIKTKHAEATLAAMQSKEHHVKNLDDLAKGFKKIEQAEKNLAKREKFRRRDIAQKNEDLNAKMSNARQAIN